MVPWENPFDKMELSYDPRPTRPVTHAELERLVPAADEAGESSLGTGAMIAYYWLQREEDIIGRLSWSDYRPVIRLILLASFITRPGNWSIFRYSTRMGQPFGRN